MKTFTGKASTLILGIVIGAVVVGGLVYIVVKPKNNTANTAATVSDGNTDTATETAPTPASVDAASLVNATDYYRGKNDAKVTMVVFSDYQCPYCGKFNATVKQVMESYSDKVKWVHKHFPWDFHEYAQKSAEASECAGEQNKFWEYGDYLFANQASITGLDYLKTTAKNLGLNTDQFNTCLDTGKFTSKVTADQAQGANIGIQGTPGGYVNNLEIAGAISADKLKGLIDTALANAEK